MRTRILLLFVAVLLLYGCGEKDGVKERVRTRIENLSSNEDVSIKVLSFGDKYACQWDLMKDEKTLIQKIGQSSYDKLLSQQIKVSAPFVASKLGRAHIDLAEAQSAAKYIDKVLKENNIKPTKYFITCEVEMKRSGLKMQCTYACLVDGRTVDPLLVDDTINLGSY